MMICAKGSIRRDTPWSYRRAGHALRSGRFVPLIERRWSAGGPWRPWLAMRGTPGGRLQRTSPTWNYKVLAESLRRQGWCT